MGALLSGIITAIGFRLGSDLYERFTKRMKETEAQGEAEKET